MMYMSLVEHPGLVLCMFTEGAYISMSSRQATHNSSDALVARCDPTASNLFAGCRVTTVLCT